MREIKFRFWDEKEKSMTYDFTIKTKDGKNEIDIIVAHIPSYISMQYTGIKDKNGKDIYEGDIVKANGNKIVKTKDNSELRRYVNANIKDEFKIIKEKGLFVSEWENIFSSFQFIGKTHSINVDVSKRDLEIIGNIHENPELLK